jgi:acyl-CoA thioester hydrolase
MGHANLRAYGEFFEQALWQLFFHLGLTPTVLRGDIRMAGVQQNISYRRELVAGDLVCVRSRLAEISERKLRMEHELFNVESNEVCAICELTAVCIDASTRKPRALPPAVKARAARLIDRTQS